MSFGDILLSALPLIILIGAVFVLVPFLQRRFSAPGSIAAQHLALAERQTKALERIADALEKRP